MEHKFIMNGNRDLLVRKKTFTVVHCFKQKISSTSGLAIKQNSQWCFCLESYFASPAHLSLALKQLTQVLILRANEVCQNKALISIIFLKPGDDNLFDIADVLVVQLLEDFNLLDGP